MNDHTNETTTPARFHHATIERTRYYPGSDASADAVSRGLAIRTIGTIGALALLSIEGARESAERWTNDHGGALAEPSAFVVRSVEFDHHAEQEQEPASERDSVLADRMRFAGGLVLRALESYGSDALALAENARVLVGTDGIDEFAHTLADSGDVETCWTIRGALAALLGDECPEIGGAYESEARDGFDFVSLGGFAGAWA